MAGNYIERLKKRQEAATGEPEPKAPEPEALPTDPTIRSELLADALADARQELAQERERRKQAERRAEQQARPASLGDFLRGQQVHKRRTWR
jgi:hypothetical protein